MEMPPNGNASKWKRLNLDLACCDDRDGCKSWLVRIKALMNQWSGNVAFQPEMNHGFGRHWLLSMR